MKDYNYLFDKNIEINLTANNSSMNNNKDQINITSIKQNLSKPYNYNLLLPSYNQRQYKDEKSSSLINKNKVVKKNEFFEENDNYENKISKINSKFSTCNNYYPRKNYNKFLNSHQQIHSSSLMNNNNVYQQNVTFEGSTGYNRLNTRDLIEITKRRKEIIEHQKLKEEEKKRMMENNLNNLESIDIIENKNSNRSNIEDKNYCDEGVQTSLLNINFQENENNNNNNKKDEPLSTIIFTDKSALINQEITFLSIQYSIKNNEDNSNDIKEYKNIENDLVNIEYNPKESIQKDKDKYNDFNNDDNNKNNKNNNKNNKDNDKLNDENFDIILNNDNEDKNKNEIIDSYSISQSEVKKSKNNDINKNDDNLSSKKEKNENNCNATDFKEDNNCGNLNKESDLEFTIINNNQNSPQKLRKEEDNCMSNKKEDFQIESNGNANDTKDNNFTLTNNDVNINKINNFNEEVKILSDSMEVSNENISNKSINNINESNSEENELTEIEEYDQNLIFLQNESKTMSSHFDKIKKNRNGNEESQEGKKSNKNKHNILIKDDFNASKDNFGNYSKTVDLDKEDSLNEVLPSFETKVDYENKNEDLYNNYSKCDYKENLFRSKGKKSINSINKYDDYPTLRNIKDNKNQITKLYNNKNNLTNNNRYQNKNINYEGKDVECFELLKLKESDLKQNNQEEKIIMKPLKKSNNNDSTQNVKSCNEPKNNFQNMKFSSHKKLNTNIPDKNKNNISGIPINPSKTRHNTHITENLESNNLAGINNPSLKNSKGNNNYLITPRCFKKKRQLNNYSEYYKLKMSMNKCDKSENNSKNYKSLGHKKSTESFNK